MDGESLKVLLGKGWTLEQIAAHFGRHPSTVSYWMNKHGLLAVNRERHAARGGIEERLTALVEAGMSIAQIAEELDRSKATVRHWLKRHGLSTKNPPRRRSPPLVEQAKADGVQTVVLPCEHHGETEFVLEGRGYFRCKRCRVEAINRRRRKVKAILVAEAGGRCCVCGYDGHPAALEFHHLDPSLKRLNVSASGVGLALETLRAEARKCVLLCSNCHAEVEHGGRALPLNYPDG